MSFIKAGPSWVARNWVELMPKIAALVLEAEGIVPGHKELNDLLAGFQTRALDLWLFIREERIIGFVVVSYGFGGPVGNTACYIRQLRALEKVLYEEWEEAFEKLKKEAFRRGCTHIIATTESEQVIALADKLGAYKDTRLIWEVSDNG